MKAIPSALQAHYASGATTLADALRITRTDGRVFAYTSGSVDATIAGVLYSAAQGLNISGIATSVGLGVDNLELTTLDDGTLFTVADVRAGAWQNASFVILRYNWASLTDGVEYLLSGTIGNVTLKLGSIVAELRGLQQYLQQPVGNVTSMTCRARLADQPAQAGNNRCGLVAASLTDTLTVTAVADRRTFTATGTARAADWYTEGIATWSAGANVGLKAKIKAYSGAQVFELVTAMQRDIAVGDTLTALAGCRKRLAEDCLAKFNNAINFQGEPHMPGMDALTQTPATSA